MNCPPLQRSPSRSRSSPSADHILTQEISEFRQGSIISHCAENLAVESEYDSSFGVAKPRRVLNQGIEDWLEIKGGATDDFEHFTRGSLLFQRFLQFLEQPHVLDGDHGLVGKGFKKRDLLVGTRLCLHPPDANASNRLSFTEHRSSQHRSCSRGSAAAPGFGKLV